MYFNAAGLIIIVLKLEAVFILYSYDIMLKYTQLLYVGIIGVPP